MRSQQRPPHVESQVVGAKVDQVQQLLRVPNAKRASSRRGERDVAIGARDKVGLCDSPETFLGRGRARREVGVGVGDGFAVRGEGRVGVGRGDGVVLTTVVVAGQCGVCVCVVGDGALDDGEGVGRGDGQG